MDLRFDKYEFAFLPNADADFHYEIRTKLGKVLKSDDLYDLPKRVVVTIPWNAAGQIDDMYQLQGTATFVLANGNTVSQKVGFDFMRRGTVRAAPN
jgi:hypothetical protein